MGAWGAGSFENDDALDWLAELAGRDDWSVVERALQEVVEATDYLEAPLCSSAVAAAEVVAAGIGTPTSNLPDEISEFIQVAPRPDLELVKTAMLVIDRILNDSELLELWQESDKFESWVQAARDLKRRLDRKGERSNGTAVAAVF